MEKPKTPEAIDACRTPPGWMEANGYPSKGREHLASMGIYVFKREALLSLLMARPLATDFGKEIFPRSLKTHHVQAHLFDGYWEDLGTVKAYHEANLALAGDEPPFDFHSPEGVIYTRMRFLPASRIEGARLRHCLISDGCVIEQGADLETCVVGVRSRIGAGAVIRNTVILGADRFETEAERKANRAAGKPDLLIGEGTRIDGAILDKEVRIGRNVRITSKADALDEESETHVVRDGVVVIPRGTVIPDGTVI